MDRNGYSRGAVSHQSETIKGKGNEREIGIETGSVYTLIRMLAIGMMVLGAVFAVLDRYTPRRHLLAGFPHRIFAVGPDPAPQTLLNYSGTIMKSAR